MDNILAGTSHKKMVNLIPDKSTRNVRLQKAGDIVGQTSIETSKKGLKYSLQKYKRMNLRRNSLYSSPIKKHHLGRS